MTKKQTNEMVHEALRLQGVKASTHYLRDPEWEIAEDQLKPIRKALGLEWWQHVTHSMTVN